MAEARVAVIGGSGLYDMESLTDIREVIVTTPFGDPSDAIAIGDLDGVPVAFLPRHGRGHRYSPTEIPVRANIFALKQLGVEWIISVSAVGSLREEIAPLHMVVPDQLIDRTKNRVNSFFGEGLVVHCSFADPFCSHLSERVALAASDAGGTLHRGGCLVVMEGPLFSTKAESNLYRSWGASIIGMTALPEAKLAREAEICYATLACVTDYDVWHPDHDHVSIDMVIANLRQNVAVSRQVVQQVVASLAAEPARSCPCATALENAIITSREAIPAVLSARLEPLIGKYLN